MLRVAPLVVIAVTGCTAARVECAVHDGPAWHEARAQRFVVRSNLAADGLQREVTYLEQLLTAIELVLDDATPVVEPIQVILVHPGDLAELGHDAARIDGQGSRQPVLLEAWSAGQKPEGLAHELAHVVMERSMPSAPRWIREGLATYLETVAFDGVRQMRVGGGLRSYQYVVLTSGGLKPEDLWRWGTLGEPFGDERSHLYAWSWGIVDYLLKHERTRFSQLLAALRRNNDGRLAFDRVFPRFEAKELTAAAEHLTGGEFTAMGFELPIPPPAPGLRELSAGEVHLARAEILGAANHLNPEEREERRREEQTIATELGTEPPPRHDEEPRPGPQLEAVPARPLDEDELTWALKVLNSTIEQQAEAARLIDDAPPIMDIVALRRVWVAAAVLGDCERLARVHEDQVRRFEAHHAAETAQMKRRYEALCAAPSEPPAFSCAEGERGYPDDVLNALLADRTRRMGALTGAVTSVEEIEGDVLGTVPLVVRADGSIEAGPVTLEPPKRLLITGFARVYERLRFPKPCGGDVAYDVPVSFRRAPRN